MTSGKLATRMGAIWVLSIDLGLSQNSKGYKIDAACQALGDRTTARQANFSKIKHNTKSNALAVRPKKDLVGPEVGLPQNALNGNLQNLSVCGVLNTAYRRLYTVYQKYGACQLPKTGEGGVF